MKTFLLLHNHTPHRPNEELFINYGENKDNHRHFLTHGFVDRDNPNPVEIPIVEGAPPLELQPPNAHQLAVLRRLGMPVQDPSVVAWPPLVVGGPGMLNALKLALAVRLVSVSPSTAEAVVKKGEGGPQGLSLVEFIFKEAPPVAKIKILYPVYMALGAQLLSYGPEVVVGPEGFKDYASRFGSTILSPLVVMEREEIELLRAAAYSLYIPLKPVADIQPFI